MSNLVFVPFITFAVVFSFENGDRCITPNGELATCVPVHSCAHILESLLSLSLEALDFAKESQCRSDNETLICCGNATSLNLKTEFPIGRLIPNKSTCGIQDGSNRIYGGQLTTIEEFPWLALLSYIDDSEVTSFKCGGSVINSRYVLTAAHCIRINPAQGISLHSVRLGEWNVTSDEDCEEPGHQCADPFIDLKIEKKIPHPMYSMRTGENDIGLLRLERNFEFSAYIMPICLPFNGGYTRISNKPLVVSGWGATEYGPNSEVKLKLKVSIVSNEQCQKALGHRGTISPNQICAGGEKGKDACQGDSGGPLMSSWELQDMKTQWYLDGIVSWGSKCGVLGFPGIYTRVSKYLIWIIDNVEEF